MNKRLLISTLLFLLVVPFSVLVLVNEKNFEREQKEQIEENVDSDIILYYSDMCTHCQNVEKFLTDNKVDDKIAFARKNVRGSSANTRELLNKATLCGEDSETLSVPFLWDGENGNTCIKGDVDIIAFFQNKLNAK